MNKICHMTSAHKSDDGRIFRNECSSLANAGYDVYLVAQGDSRTENNVHVIGVGEKPSSRIKRMLFFSKKVYKKALELDCEVYHLHDPELLTYAIKLKKHGKKVIFDSHENTLEQIEDKTWIPKIIRKPVSFMYKRYAQNVFKKLDGLISVTPHIVEQLKNYNSNTWMVTNYPQFLDYSKTDKKDIFSLCFTGGIESQWNHDIAIKAISNIKDSCYLLCGKADEDYLKGLQNDSSWECVQYFGMVKFAESIKVQLQSHAGLALLQPSNNTGGIIGTIGNTKLFEYMMAGLPIICTNFKLWEEIVNKWQCGICVEPNSVEEVENAIRLLKNNPEKAIEMGKNGRRAVEECYNWSTQEKILLDMYSNII